MAIDLPPKIEIARPAIILPGEPWERRVNADLIARGFPLSVRQDVVRAIRKVMGENPAIVRATLDDLASYARAKDQPSLAHLPGMAALWGARRPGTYSFLANIEDVANATTYSGGVWDGVSIGDADPDRYVLVAVWGNNGTRTVSSMTIGGVSATLVSDGTDSARLQHGNGTGEFWIANVPTGTTANISVTWSGGQTRCGATVWTIVRPTSTTAVDVKTSNSASPASVTLDTASNGVVFAIHGQNGSGSCTWTNVTERHDTAIEAGVTHTGADAATSGSSLAVTATFTGSPAVRTLVCVSFNLEN